MNVTEGINNDSQIVGIYKVNVPTMGEQYRGLLYENGTFIPIDVTLPGAHNTIVFDVNDGGQIVGWYSDPSGVEHGFVYQKGVYTSIDVPGSTLTIVTGINQQGDIVGNYIDRNNVQHGFVAR
jgi:probable HAF family extracellular repeat protein